MKQISKDRREANLLRERIESMLAEPEGWRYYQAQRRWLHELLKRDASYIFTKGERDAVGRMSYARTFFDGWATYSVQELVREARSHMADFDYDDFLNEIEHATRLVRGEMGTLVSLCRMTMNIPPFGQPHERYEDA